MPRTGSTTARTAAGLAPLALAVLLQRAVLPGGTSSPAADSTDAAVCTEDVGDEQECHTQFPTGCSPSARYDGFLNILKNQVPPATEKSVRTLGGNDISTLNHSVDDISSKASSPLSKANHLDFREQLGQLGEGRIHTVVGYLYYAKKGGKESVNCELQGDDDIDFHIAIGFDPALAAKVLAHQSRSGKLTPKDESDLKKTSMIVEMTPHYRAKVKSDWNLDLVKTALGRPVKVTGILLLDNEHQDPKDNCALGNSDTCWRSSTWELHPVTEFQVCTAASCTENSSDWVDLTDFDPKSAAPTK
jgi:hypothetical protein